MWRKDKVKRPFTALSTACRSAAAAPPSASTLFLESILDGTVKRMAKKRKKGTSDTSTSATTSNPGNGRALPTAVILTSESLPKSKEPRVQSLAMLHGKQKKRLLQKARHVERDIQPHVPADSHESHDNPPLLSPSLPTYISKAKHSVLSSSLSIQIRGGSKRLRVNNADPARVSLSPLAMKDQNEEHPVLKPKTTRTSSSAVSTTTQPVRQPRDAPIQHVTPAESSSPLVNVPWSVTDMEQAAAALKRHRHPPDGVFATQPTAMNGRKPRPTTSQDNFVKLNLRNHAGACRGARNPKFKSRNSKYSQHPPNDRDNQRGGMTACGAEVGGESKSSQTTKQTRPTRRQNTIDPLDDYLDGTLGGIMAQSKTVKQTPATTVKRESTIPKCARHARPCKLVVVKKTTSGNQGRQFYACGMPRGEQCDHFEWAEDTLEAAQLQLLKQSSRSGFVARQVSTYVDRFKTLTVPELKEEAKRRGLLATGNKQPLLLRLSLWVRDEVSKSVSSEIEVADETPSIEEVGATDTRDKPDPQDVDGLEDDLSTSSMELEIAGDRNGGAKDEEDSDEEDVFEDEKESSEDDDTATTKSKVNPVSSSTKANAGELVLTPLQQSLFDLFGYSSFREGQDWAVNRCLYRQRTLLVAPTGFGKSLCYSLPASMLEGTCIVVSPLISLIEDQLRHLPPRVPAATLSGGMTAARLAAVIDDVLRGRIKILFVSPERLTTTSFRRLFQAKWNQETKAMERPFPPVSLLCVDEAHCLSQWAHNFRPSYLRIRSLMDLILPASVLAVTATAGPKVIHDICRSLKIPHSHDPTQAASNDECNGVKILGCDRDNIDISCVILPSEESRLHMVRVRSAVSVLLSFSSRLNLLSLCHQQLSKLMSDCSTANKSAGQLSDGSLSKGNVIIYVWRKRDTEVIAETLMASGVSGGVVVYHGGMDASARSRAQGRFMRGKARICVCTVAFGLGINKADVDAVVHLNLPASPEHYLQEIGRAGRDGRAAKAIALILQNELVVRHSLAYSDLISESQVMTLLMSLRASVRSAITELSSGGESPESTVMQGTLHIALPLESTATALDMKAESVETLLSLMEERCPEDPLITVQGKVNDLVAVLLKRRQLDKLAAVEHVAMCIQKCARRLDQDESDPGKDSFSRRAALEAYSFGLYEFSATRCAVLLGPQAETRHVFAALRRLQSTGELELSFQPLSLALQLKVEEKGRMLFVAQEEALDDLAKDLTKQFSDHVRTGAQKVLDIHEILTKISEVGDDNASHGPGETEKSARLVRFQALVKEKISGGTTTDCDTLSVAFSTLSESDERNVAFDAASLTRDLLSACAEYLNIVDSNLSVGLCERVYPDYTALCLSKFFHGIAMVRAPLSNFAGHPLFGKWRNVRFDCILESVSRAVSAVAAKVTMPTTINKGN